MGHHCRREIIRIALSNLVVCTLEKLDIVFLFPGSVQCRGNLDSLLNVPNVCLPLVKISNAPLQGALYTWQLEWVPRSENGSLSSNERRQDLGAWLKDGQESRSARLENGS